MQLLNSVLFKRFGGWVNLRRKPIVVLLVLVFFAFIIFLVLQPSKQNNDRRDESFDNFSGEIISDPENRDPERFAQLDSQITFYGFGSLLELGVSSYQLDAIKTAFRRYVQESDSSVKIVSLEAGNIQAIPHASDDQNSRDALWLNIRLDRGVFLRSKVEYFNITSVRLYLYNHGSQSAIYDSGDLDISGDAAEAN